LEPASVTLDDDATTPVQQNVGTFSAPAGAGYSVAAPAVAGWDPGSATCSDGSNPSNIDLSLGEVVDCTFVYRKRPAIQVIQNSQPNDPQAFSYTAGGGLSPSSFQLVDNGGNNAMTFSNLTPGSGYSVEQSGTPAGWDPAQVTCSDGSSPSNIDVSYGETVYCTFTNFATVRGQITVQVDQQPDSSEIQVFRIDGQPAVLNDDGTNADGWNNLHTVVVKAGTHDVRLQTTNLHNDFTPPPSGHFWQVVSSSCSDGSTAPVIEVSADEHVICDFVVTRAGLLTVSLDNQPICCSDPTDFEFTTGGGLSPSSFVLDYDSTSSTALRSRNFIVPIGSGYSVSETTPPGWDLTSATCSDGSPVSNISISADERTECTFRNSKRGTITARVDTQPNSGQDFTFTTGGGLSPTSFLLDDDGDNANELSNQRTFSNLPGGTGYSLAESVPPFWSLQSAACSDGSDPSNIALGSGENVICTFTNVPNYPGYARPKGATPIRATLVPAYQPCGATDRQHAGPLSYGACAPQSGSAFLTVGTPDANGQAARSVSILKMIRTVGDLHIDVHVDDVRRASDLADYTGDLEARFAFKLTDKHSEPLPTNATTQQFGISVPVPCTATADNAMGAACDLVTDVNSLLPGAFADGRRAMLETGAVEVYDGGPDSDADTAAGNTVFMRQGIFVP
jgi:hypothetical protein